MSNLPSFPDRTSTSHWQAAPQDGFPGSLGIELGSIEPGRVTGRMPVLGRHLSANGFLHAGAVVTLADTVSGAGCLASLPEGASGFTTIELKSNHLGTVREGAISAVATLVHGGRTTQVWDAIVSDEATGKAIAMFRCTQMVLYPRA